MLWEKFSSVLKCLSCNSEKTLRLSSDKKGMAIQLISCINAPLPCVMNLTQNQYDSIISTL